MNRTAALSPAFSGAICANLFEDGLPYEQQTGMRFPRKSQEIVTAVLTAGGHGEGASALVEGHTAARFDLTCCIQV